MDYARLKAEHEELKRDLQQCTCQYERELKNLRDELSELKVKTSEKFKDLYHSRNETQNALTELTTTVKILVQSIEREFTAIDKKLDDIQNRFNKEK